MNQCNYLFFVVIVIIQLLFVGCGSSIQFVDVLHGQTPESKLSLCKFQLLAGSGSAAMFGIAGMIFDEIKNNKDKPYYEELSRELFRIYEDTLKLSRTFQYCPAEKLVTQQDGKIMPADMIAKNNGFLLV